jgi:hypothetical protein
MADRSGRKKERATMGMGPMNIQTHTHIHTPKFQAVKPLEMRVDLFLTNQKFFELIASKEQKKVNCKILTRA